MTTNGPGGPCRSRRRDPWLSALRLAPLSAGEQAGCIAELDAEVAEIANLVRKPGPLIGLAARVVRLGERRTVPEIIEILT